MITEGISFADAGNTLKVVDNLNRGNITGALTTAANLSGSSDAQTAAAGLNLINAVKTGDMTQIAGAFGGLNNTLNATNNVVTQLQNSGLVDTSGSTNLSNITGTSNLANRNVVSSITDDTSGINTLDFGGGSNILVNASNYIDNEFGDLQGAIDRNAATVTKPLSFNATFDASAANMRRRVAVRSRAFGSPHGSKRTDESAEQRTDSSVARSASRISPVVTNMRRLGSRPNAASPGP
jgi:hypothetical protein